MLSGNLTAFDTCRTRENTATHQAFVNLSLMSSSKIFSFPSTMVRFTFQNDCVIFRSTQTLTLICCSQMHWRGFVFNRRRYVGHACLWTAVALWLALSVHVVSGQGIRVWHNRARSQNPCPSRPCPPPFECFNQAAGGRTCFNPAIGVTLQDHGVSALSRFNIKVWFDASDLNGNSVPDAEEGYVPVGGLVNDWVSRVGGITATAVGSSPSLDASTVGGKPSVYFVSRRLVTSVISLSEHFVFFIVLQLSSGTSSVVVEHGGNSNTQNGFGLVPTQVRVRRDDTVGLFPTTWGPMLNTPKLGTLFTPQQTTQWEWRTNGISEGVFLKSGGTFSVLENLHIGCRAGSTACMNGYIAEIIIIDSILPLSDIQAVENYLMTKYSIT
jgi:hypothetical protein